MNRIYYEDLGNTSEGVVGLHMGYTKMTRMAKEKNKADRHKSRAYIDTTTTTKNDNNNINKNNNNNTKSK